MRVLALVLMLLGTSHALVSSQPSLFVTTMTDIFMVRDGSSIANSSDPYVLTAITRELRLLMSNFSSIQTLQDLRDPDMVSDAELVRLLMLAIMGNFHRHTLGSSSVFDDVQIVYDPISSSFVTTQNLRQTEITIFQALLVISVIGLSTMFIMDTSAPTKPTMAAALHPPKHIQTDPIRIRVPF